jgi:hypothetical protein
MSLISALFTGWHRVLAAVERKGKTLLKVEGPLDLFCSLGCILGRHYSRLGPFSPVITSMVAQSGPRCGEGAKRENVFAAIDQQSVERCAEGWIHLVDFGASLVP